MSASQLLISPLAHAMSAAYPELPPSVRHEVPVLRTFTVVPVDLKEIRAYAQLLVSDTSANCLYRSTAARIVYVPAGNPVMSIHW